MGCLTSTPEKRIEYCKFISSTFRASFNERRKHEFKILFTVLTFYVLSASAAITIIDKPSQAFLGTLLDIIVYVVFMGLAAAAIAELYNVHIANDMDKTFSENAEEYIAAAIEGRDLPAIKIFRYGDRDSLEYTRVRHSKTFRLSFWIWHSIIILIFAFTTAFFITNMF